jgi:hypothetical protein
MQLSTERILTTDAGSLPRPERVAMIGAAGLDVFDSPSD